MPIAASGFTQELDAEMLTHHPVEAKKNTEGYVNYVRSLNRLDEVLPQDRVLVTDGGRFMTEVWCRIATPDPRSFVATVNFGSIGLGLPEAIGASVAAEGRPVVLFCGDGGFMMGGITEFTHRRPAGIGPDCRHRKRFCLWCRAYSVPRPQNGSGPI